MYGVGMVLSLVGLGRWGGRPGTGLLLLALSASLACVLVNLRQEWSAGQKEDDH
jgi:hypothetical protein